MLVSGIFSSNNRVGKCANVLLNLAQFATVVALSVFAIQTVLGKNMALSGRNVAIMAIALGGYMTLRALKQSYMEGKSWLSTLIAAGILAIPLILGSLHLSPQRILDLKQLAWGLIGSTTIMYGLLYLMAAHDAMP